MIPYEGDSLFITLHCKIIDILREGLRSLDSTPKDVSCVVPNAFRKVEVPNLSTFSVI